MNIKQRECTKIMHSFGCNVDDIINMRADISFKKYSRESLLELETRRWTYLDYAIECFRDMDDPKSADKFYRKHLLLSGRLRSRGFYD